jgi:diguanylate cyclase (GGDEF)-like protein
MKHSMGKIVRPAAFACASLAGMASAIVGGIPLALATSAVIALVAYAGPEIAARFFSRAEAASSAPSPRANAQVLVDPLTGLANEAGLLAWISDNAPRVAKDGKSIVVLSSDLDGFDTLERTRGKEAADAVLIEVARRVASCTGENGIAARTGTDEFAAIATVVPWQSREIAADQAGKLAELIQRPVELATGVVWIGGFVGAAAGSPNEALAVLAHAREALKQAKIMGRGHFKVYDPDHPE